MAVANPTPTPLTHNELNDLLDYGNWRMNHSQCFSIRTGVRCA
ncbi:hypothetical protein ACVXG7_22880 [Enterobacter hormaechei]